jgi:hypothetical protein
MQVGHRDRYQRTLEALQTDRENRRRYRAVRAATVHEYAGLVHDWFKYTLIWKKNKSTQFCWLTTARWNAPKIFACFREAAQRCITDNRKYDV